MIEATILLLAITVGVLIQLRRERRKIIDRDRIEARREEIVREQRRAGMRGAERR